MDGALSDADTPRTYLERQRDVRMFDPVAAEVRAVLDRVWTEGEETDAQETERSRRFLHITPDPGAFLHALARPVWGPPGLGIRDIRWLLHAVAGGYPGSPGGARDHDRTEPMEERAGPTAWCRSPCPRTGTPLRARM